MPSWPGADRVFRERILRFISDGFVSCRGAGLWGVSTEKLRYKTRYGSSVMRGTEGLSQMMGSLEMCEQFGLVRRLIDLCALMVEWGGR